MCSSDLIRKLPCFYACEYLIPCEFSNSPEFQGFRAHCVRPLAWLANYHRPYPLLGIPDPLPTTLEEYAEMRNQSPGRDYSFVAIRDTERLEFRSACSQNSVDDIIRLIQFRLRTDQLASQTENIPDRDAMARFQDACLYGPENLSDSPSDLRFLPPANKQGI